MVSGFHLLEPFFFFFFWNLSGALLSWKIIKLSHGELSEPTNDINTTLGISFTYVTSLFLSWYFNKRIDLFW